MTIRSSRTIRCEFALVAILFLAGCGVDKAAFQTSSETEHPMVDEAELRGQVRTRFDSPDPTPAQLARRAESIKVVQELGLPWIDHLPVVEDAAAITSRTSEEIAQRCLATTICAVKGESGDHELAQDMVERLSASEYLSPDERVFVASPDPPQQDRVDFAWRYECVHVFLWAIGYLDELKPPNEICDVATEMGIIRDAGADSFIAGAQARPIDEILDANDLYYCLHWAAIELRLNGEPSEAANEEIIAERHRALNWLIRYMDQEWDDVTTDT